MVCRVAITSLGSWSSPTSAVAQRHTDTRRRVEVAGGPDQKTLDGASLQRCTTAESALTAAVPNVRVRVSKAEDSIRATATFRCALLLQQKPLYTHLFTSIGFHSEHCGFGRDRLGDIFSLLLGWDI